MEKTHVGRKGLLHIPRCENNFRGINVLKLKITCVQLETVCKGSYTHDTRHLDLKEGTISQQKPQYYLYSVYDAAFFVVDSHLV